MVLSFISFAESLVQKSSQDRRLKILVSLHWERKFSKFLCCLSFSSLDSGQVKKVVHRVLFCWAVPWCILSRGKRLSLLISDLRVIKISIQQVFIHNRDKGVLERSIVCLFGPWNLVQLWVGPCCGVQPQAQGVGMFVTLLLHLKVL